MNSHPEISSYIKQKNPSRVLLRYLTAIPEDIRDSVNKILKISNPNPATLKQLIELTSDINSKTGSNPLDNKGIIELIKNSGIKDAVKKLRRMRMPKTNKIISEINNEIKNIELKVLKIDFDQSFESRGLTLSADISSLKDAELLKEELNDITASGVLERIIKKYKMGD
ncbi:MAG: hypothetical protein NTY22_03495 [Proteobacteria bacterium]|nr:hypothetical protein [Pseudomonadota bacterium]